MTKPPTSPDEIYRSVGAQIRSARMRAKLRQDDLAQALGLTRTSVVNIERGRQRLLLHTVLAICRYLRVTPAQLLVGVVFDEVHDDVPSEIHDYSPQLKNFILSGVQAARSNISREK